MNVIIEKVIESAQLPEKSTTGAAAYDLRVPFDYLVPSGRSVIPLGFKMQIQEGLAALVFSRSGYEAKGFEDKDGNRRDANVKLGLIDSDYRGECGVLIDNMDKPFEIAKGQRIAQLLLTRAYDSPFTIGLVNSTERGTGGFGHTGSK